MPSIAKIKSFIRDVRIEHDRRIADSLGGGVSGGLSGTLAGAVEDFFTTKDEFKERYAQAPFDSDNVFGLDLSNLVDGTNFELDTENLTDGQVTRIRSGVASYHINNGISRGYVEVKTRGRCRVTVIYSISSQASYDYGGCIITEDAPNTTFTLADLKKANLFYKSGSYANQTATYNCTLLGDRTRYLNFGYAKNASTNSNDDRFYIHSIKITPLDVEGPEAVKNFTGATSVSAGTNGLVPAPTKTGYYLCSNGTWAMPKDTTYTLANTSSNGLMSNISCQMIYGTLPIRLGTCDTVTASGALWYEVDEE